MCITVIININGYIFCEILLENYVNLYIIAKNKKSSVCYLRKSGNVVLNNLTFSGCFKMSKKFLNQLKNRLKERRHHLLKEVNLRLGEFKDAGGCRLRDTADIASNLIEDEIVMSIAQGEAREIEQIDNALSQIKMGNYGICEDCGTKINKRRLIAIPFVNLCVKCKEAEERDEGIETNRGGYYKIEAVEYGEFETDEEKSNNIKHSESIDINPYDN